MDDAASTRESRRVLRKIQAHMTQMHINLGAEHTVMGLVDVLSHPNSTLPHLNYVSPRKNTAWIPGPEIEKGLQNLRDRNRRARVYLIEGLYPPLFSRSLHDLGLTVERELSIMAYKVNKGLRMTIAKPDSVNASIVTNQEGIALWWYVWRNARYDVVTDGIEPVYIGQDMRQLALGNQTDIILYREKFPIGVARLTLNDDTANITAAAVLREARTPENIRLLYQTAIETAIKHDCKLVFTAGETEADRRLCRKIGFVDAGSVICYAESSDSQHETNDDNYMEQPAFIMQ